MNNNIVLDNLLSSIIYIDQHQHIKYINTAAEELFAISHRQTLDMPIEYLLPIPSILESIQLCSQQGFSQMKSELFINPRLQQEMFISCDINPIVTEKTPYATVIEIRTAEQVERLCKESEEKHTVLQQLLNNLAHEIKNPLGGIRGSAQLLESELRDDLKEYTQVIMKESDRLKSLIDKLFGPNQEIIRTSNNIHQIIEHVVTILSAEYNEVKFQKDYDPSIPDMMIDKDQMIQALLNVVKNAAQAIEKNGKITIQTRIKQYSTLNKTHKLFIDIAITDNGGGIPEEYQQKIFYPMVTRRAEGTGLGLAISETILNKHHGTIRLQSMPGETTFTLSFPIN